MLDQLLSGGRSVVLLILEIILSYVLGVLRCGGSLRDEDLRVGKVVRVKVSRCVEALVHGEAEVHVFVVCVAADLILVSVIAAASDSLVWSGPLALLVAKVCAVLQLRDLHGLCMVLHQLEVLFRSSLLTA